MLFVFGGAAMLGYLFTLGLHNLGVERSKKSRVKTNQLRVELLDPRSAQRP
jgi:hypothetical protein